MQLEDLLGRGNGLLGNWENGDLPRMTELSQFSGR